MVTLQIAWSYIKRYWSIFALVAGFVVFELLLQRNQKADFAKTLDDINKKHQQELDDIQKAHDLEDQQHQANEAKMAAQLAAIEKQYEAAQQQLDEAKRAEIKQIIADTQNDPVALAQKLSDVTGFPVVLPSEG